MLGVPPALAPPRLHTPTTGDTHQPRVTRTDCGMDNMPAALSPTRLPDPAACPLPRCFLHLKAGGGEPGFRHGGTPRERSPSPGPAAGTTAPASMALPPLRQPPREPCRCLQPLTSPLCSCPRKCSRRRPLLRTEAAERGSPQTPTPRSGSRGTLAASGRSWGWRTRRGHTAWPPPPPLLRQHRRVPAHPRALCG